MRGLGRECPSSVLPTFCAGGRGQDKKRASESRTGAARFFVAAGTPGYLSEVAGCIAHAIKCAKYFLGGQVIHHLVYTLR